MRIKLFVTLIALVSLFGGISPSYAGYYTYGPNGRITYHEEPSDFPRAQRHHQYRNQNRYIIPRQRNSDRRFNGGRERIFDDLLSLGVGVVIGGLAAKGNQEQAFAQACDDLGGQAVKELQTGKLICVR